MDACRGERRSSALPPAARAGPVRARESKSLTTAKKLPIATRLHIWRPLLPVLLRVRLKIPTTVRRLRAAAKRLI